MHKYCEGCRRAGKDKRGKACSACGYGQPEPLPNNEDALEVFRLADTQWHRVGMTGALAGLDYPACFVLADKLGIPAAEHEDLLRRLKVLERARLKIEYAAAKEGTADKNSDKSKTI